MNLGKTVAFIDGANLYRTSKLLGFDIDYKKLLDALGSLGNLLRTNYYTCIDEQEENSAIIPLIDWLDYNGYSVVTKDARSFVDIDGRKRLRGRVSVEIAVDALEIAPHVDNVLLVTGDSDFEYLLGALKRKGKLCTVISSVITSPPVCSDNLRRGADVFIDLEQIRTKIARSNVARGGRGPGAVSAA
jgi:uncharacterized LabA/DUF88 family protein